MPDYRSSAPMVFGAKPGEKITDMDWEIAVGLRCPECYTRLTAENHCPNPHHVEDPDHGRTVCGICMKVQDFPHSHAESDATGYVELEPAERLYEDVVPDAPIVSKSALEPALGWFDGGSSKNPGPGAFAWAIETADHVTYTGMRPLGVVTNNFAEYSGLIALLERVRELGIKKIEIRGDSNLVIEQMKGNWKVKNAELKPLHAKASELASGLDVNYVWIPREDNERCDAAVKFAIKESNNAKS